ncbi:murein biosynthesis integral membrane protein MurJ [Kitasatospora sp. NA04385]|uniref:murein biosynthesis integral membrane protein MurJ n=1 Tax=Kitasatospora sp. NA04385 TaxID=2742135 RepID=UPI00159147E8|nr:murein biosynthesis integral membrane protein MurJ [Kitasatospora sp. NA04385]QKW20758.1 murein biosynthesis integral membrane protein MurJ [Kitasatospora sp. NA04385]
MNERSERATQDQGGRPRERAGGPRSAAPAEPAADWYVADTYAHDPYAAEAFGSADPYGAIDLPGAGPDETDTPEASAAVPGQPGHPGEATLQLTAPAPRWASIAAEVAAEAEAPVQEGPVQEGPVQEAAQTQRAAEPEEAEEEAEEAEDAAGVAPGRPAGPPRWEVPVEPEPVEDYVGVDTLLSRTAADSTEEPGTAGPEEPADEGGDASGSKAENGEGDGGVRAAPGPRPYVPPIEFDPPLSEEEAVMRADAAVLEADAAAAPVPGGPPAPAPAPADTDAPAGTGGGGGGAARVAGLLNSSAVMAAGTLVSRGTGFLRTMVIAAAIGVASMGDSYNAANTLPTLLYILIGGGALNAVFVPQLVRSMKNDEDGGTAYANRLLTLVVTGLAGVVFVAVLAAPVLVQLISHALMRDRASADTTVALARYCLPTIFFMGVHVVMGQILNARGRFGAMMWTPVLNNVVVIFTFVMYIAVYGTFQHTEVTPQSISPEGVRLLGIGTMLGLAVQALSMIPYLRAAGFSFRPRFDWRGHGLGKAARLAKWTFLFVLANQAGFLVVTQLATASGKAAEQDGHLGVGLAAYSNALLIWQLPMAVITVSVMSAVLPRLSRAAADQDSGAVRDDLSYGLRTSAVAIVPAAFLFLSLGPVIGSSIYGLGNGGAVAHGTTAVGYMLSAFALGLIPYSVQYVLLRGFYAYEDTRTPFSNTVWVALTQAATAVLCWLVLPAQWAVTGMALGYGLSYAVGVFVAVPKLKAKVGGLDTARITKTYVRLAIASLPAAAVGLALELLALQVLDGWIGNVLTLLVAAGAQLAVFLVLARKMRIEELSALTGMVRRRLGR